MKYKNKKTGTIIDVRSKISGGDWERYTPAKNGKKSSDKNSEDDTKTEDEATPQDDTATEGAAGDNEDGNAGNNK